MITVGIYGIQDTTHGPGPTYTHDHGVALMRDGEVLTTVELERWTGRKHDNTLGRHIGDILTRLLPRDEEVRFVSVNAFVGSTFISADGNLRIEPRREVGVSAELVPAEVTWYPDGLRRRPAEGWVLCHEAAHVASLLPFCGTFEDGALAAHIDGGASRSACSFWRIEGGRPSLLDSSWDLLKDVVNNFNVNPGVRAMLGLGPHDHLAIPGRLMGLAGHGQPSDELDAWLRPQRWMLDYDDELARHALVERFGACDSHTRGCQDVAATLQRAFEREVVAAIESRAADRRALYLAGGAALNIPTNALLQRRFAQVHVPPGTNDSGLALGAAAWVEYLERGRVQRHDAFLSRFDVPRGEPASDAVAEVADRVLAGDVVGVCNGAGELGPRALGHRSIIALADSRPLRRRVSEHIKRREWYRPVAPILCSAAAREVLEDVGVQSSLSRFMLGAWRVRDAWRSALDGVLHADGTVRAQVVDDEGPSWIRDLLERLWYDHRVPALINTSLNAHGRPIVQRHEDALTLGRSLGLDAMVIHGSVHRP